MQIDIDVELMRKFMQPESVEKNKSLIERLGMDPEVFRKYTGVPVREEQSMEVSTVETGDQDLQFVAEIVTPSTSTAGAEGGIPPPSETAII